MPSEKATFVYLIGRSETGPVKIGITTNLVSRLRSLQTGSSFPLEVLYVATFWSPEEAKRVEAAFCHCMADNWLSGEWFEIHPGFGWAGTFAALEGVIDWASKSHLAWRTQHDKIEQLKQEISKLDAMHHSALDALRRLGWQPKKWDEEAQKTVFSPIEQKEQS